MARSLSRRRGHSLIEVIVGSAILGVVAMSALNLLPSSTIALESSRQRLHANDLAFALLEEARARPFGSLRPGRTLPSEDVERDGIVYKSALEVFKVPGRDPGYLLGVRAVVSWDRRGDELQESRETWVANLPR